MKAIASLFLLVTTASALNVEKLIHHKARVSDLYPSHSPEEWKEILKNLKPKEEKYEGYVPGTKPQPDVAGKAEFKLSGRIVGGHRALPYQFPWQAFIIIDDTFACGGSLITDFWILTAAHCAQEFTNFKVYLGAYILSADEPGRVEMETFVKIVHENYDNETYENDIALLLLPKPVTFSRRIRPVRLPTFSMVTMDFDYKNMTTSGWGIFSDILGVVSNILRYVTVTIMSNIDCATTYGSYIKSTNICSYGTDGVGTCNGDSGGGLIYKDKNGYHYEAGLTSFGSTTCEDGNPSVYTRISSYLKWISTHTGIQINNA